MNPTSSSYLKGRRHWWSAVNTKLLETGAEQQLIYNQMYVIVKLCRDTLLLPLVSKTMIERLSFSLHLLTPAPLWMKAPPSPVLSRVRGQHWSDIAGENKGCQRSREAKRPLLLYAGFHDNMVSIQTPPPTQPSHTRTLLVCDMAYIRVCTYTRSLICCHTHIHVKHSSTSRLSNQHVDTTSGLGREYWVLLIHVLCRCTPLNIL